MDLIPGWWNAESGTGCPSGILTKLGGFDDWAALTDKLDEVEANNALSTAAPHDLAREVDLQTLKDKHLLHPPRQMSMAIHPACMRASAPLALGKAGTVTVAIFGADSLDVAQIDPSSLRLHGATALNVAVFDVNGDGPPDMVATFDATQIHLAAQATVARLSGWKTASDSSLPPLFTW